MLKSEIVTRLIKEGHITIEEAVILMEKEVIYLPQSQPLAPIQPYNPYTPPYWIGGPGTVSITYGIPSGTGVQATNVTSNSCQIKGICTQNN